MSVTCGVTCAWNLNRISRETLLQIMSRSNESSTMEGSTILREIADFDIKAPISVTISFDDDSDEIPIKKEIVSEVYQEEAQETVVSAFFQAQPHNPSLPTEEQKNAFVVQNNYQDAPAPEPDNLKHKLLNSDTSRKRKTEYLEMCQQKQFKGVSDASDENTQKDKDTNRNNVQSNCELRTNLCEVIKNSLVATSVNPGLSNKESSANQSVLSPSLHGVDQSDKDKVHSCLTYLASLSEMMRRVMQAFAAHRQKHISLDEFQKIKEKYFNLSHKTLVTIMLPEEKNKGYLNAFVNETLRRARKKCGPYYTHTQQDYANLLHEMLMWAKKTQEPIQSAEKSQPPIIQNSALLGLEINKSSVQDKLEVTDPKKNTAADKICIFSSGPPERALSINVDPNLKQYFQNSVEVTNRLNKTNENVARNPENNNTTTQLNTAVECLTRFVSNSISSSTVHHRPPVIQPTASLTSNTAAAQIQQHTALPSNTQRCSTSNISNNIILLHQRTPAPVLQNQLRKRPLYGYLQQQLEPQPALPSYEHSLHFQAQAKLQQSTLPYDQSRRLQAQSLQQRQIPSQYNQNQLLQTQLNATQLQYLQAQPKSQYDQTWQSQGQLGQSSLPMPQYNQPRQSQVGLSQQGQCHQQLEQYPTESWPTVEELLSIPLESTPQLPYQSNNEPKILSGQWQSKQLQQTQPPQTYRTEWHQGQVYQGQIPAQTQKGSPRSASTDSGFISPLNFNVSTDQTRSEHTMPTTPQEPETSMPMIVHVTSLSDKAALVEIGKCVVCMKSTRQVCMGCRNIYYCSYRCQSLHWATHAPYCSQQNTNYGS